MDAAGGANQTAAGDPAHPGSTPDWRPLPGSPTPLGNPGVHPQDPSSGLAVGIGFEGVTVAAVTTLESFEPGTFAGPHACAK